MLEGVSAIVRKERIVASCMVRLCVASQVCMWYVFDAFPTPTELSDLENTYALLNAKRSYRGYIKKVLAYAFRYDDESRFKEFARRLTVYEPE